MHDDRNAQRNWIPEQKSGASGKGTGKEGTDGVAELHESIHCIIMQDASLQASMIILWMLLAAHSLSDAWLPPKVRVFEN